MDDFDSANGRTRLDSSLLARLREQLGPDGVVVERAGLRPYETDALSAERGTPLAALLPAGRGELRRSLEILHGAGIPFVPRGAGSGLAGAAVAERAVVVSTERMTRILRLDPKERIAVAEPGVVTDRIGEAAAPHGLRYLPDPASGAFCTLGGNVAADAGGPHCLKHGVTADHVVGLEAVLSDGRLLELRRGEDGGLDLAGLFLGSEGTLGIVSRITVGLVPRPAAVRTALALFDDLADAGRAVSEVLGSGVVPAALELVDHATIEAVEASPHAAGLPSDLAAALIIECEGFPGAVDAELEVVREAARAAGAREVRLARGAEERRRLWRARKEAYHALQTLAPDVLIQDVTVPRTALAEILPRIDRIAREHGTRVANFFHAGDGNLHPNFLFDRDDPEQVGRVRAASSKIARACVAAGGTITGEHGVGLDKRELMPLIFRPQELRRLRAVKGALDPAGLANADKIFPEASG